MLMALLAASFVGSHTVLAQNEKFDYLFQEALRQKLARSYDVAFDLYDYCLKLNPESGATLYELANLYNTVRVDSMAIKYMEKACDLYPDNYWYKNHLVMLYFKNRNNDKALKTVEDMAQRFPDKTDVLMMLLDLYEKNKDYANMVKVLDKIELKEGKSEQLSMNKFQIFLRMNDEKRAFAEMEALAKEYPNDLRYQVVKGDLYLDAGKKSEAMKVYKEVEKKDPQNVTLLLSMSNYYQMEGEDSLYQDYLTKLVTHPKLDEPTRARVLAGLVYENLGKANSDSTMILNLFDKVLEIPQESTEILELRARYMITKNMSEDDVMPYLYKILDIDPENDVARQQLLHYAIASDDIQRVIDVCKPAVEYKASEPLYYYYLGVGYVRQQNNKEALETLRQCIDRAENADENKINMLGNTYSLLGELYHQMGQDDKAFVAYDSCLIYKPKDALVLNNYAYYLSLNKKNLQRAEEMSRQANNIEPDNPTYLDTLAWVLFQLKRYNEAKEYMDKAVNLMSPEELADDEDVRGHIEQINKKAKKK